mmetsp:Transcript_5267/g.13764  ORF Transcript_5267/g.13764 Transcript_5267/m.13764 type:complete len:232 (-) Transcript_5267:1956-2651(-)
MKDGFVDHASVVVQATGKAHVEGNTIECVHRTEEIKEKRQLLQRLCRHRVLPERCQDGLARVLLQDFYHLERRPTQANDLANLIGGVGGEALLLHHFLPHLVPGLLVEFVDGTADGPELLLRHTTYRHHGIEQKPVVDLDGEFANFELVQNVDHHFDDLGVWNHGGIRPGNVEVALEKLPEPPPVHLRLITAVNPPDVVSLDVTAVVERAEPAERHRQVVPQAQDLPTLVC